MAQQHKITKKHRLLDDKGRVIEAGYATSLILDYKRKDIKARKFRIKEWDYYFVGNSKYGIAMTIADNSYMALISVTVFDFLSRWEKTKTIMVPFTFGKLKLPENSSSGITAYKNNKIDISFVNDGTTRVLKCYYKNFSNEGDLSAELVLKDEPKDSMVIVTPYCEDDKAFYYNQKINCLKAEGIVKLGNTLYEYDKTDALGVLDWGRGVWTYENTWYWGSLSTVLEDGTCFGFNIGYGFGDTSKASENMLIYNGTAHKLSLVEFIIPSTDGVDEFMKEWKFVSDDNRFEMTFEPVLDRYSKANLLILKSIQHQVFGKFTGRAILDDGKVIELNGALGFAEKVYNKF